MTPGIKLLTSILMLMLSITTAHALPDTEVTNPPTAQPVSTQNLQQTRQQIEELQFNMLELQSMLARQAPDMTLVKTKTSWIRKRLSSLHAWSLEQTTTDATEKLFSKFCWLAGDMEDEVKRDDMLDSIELQALLINFTRLENTFSQIERSEQKPTP